MQLNKFVLFLSLIVIINLGCSDNSADNGSSSSIGELSIDGTVSGYEGEGHQLFPRDRFDPLGEGAIESDGSFSAVLWSGADIEDELQQVEQGFGGFEPFPCIGEGTFDMSEPDARFAQVRAFRYGSDIGYSLVLNDQGEGDVNSLNPLLANGEKRVYWIYADRDVAIQGECDRNGVGQIEERMVDLALDAGWNEIIFDYRDRHDMRMIQGTRPASVDWYTDWN